jgi:hypothetical protein
MITRQMASSSCAAAGRISTPVSDDRQPTVEPGPVRHIRYA